MGTADRGSPCSAREACNGAAGADGRCLAHLDDPVVRAHRRRSPCRRSSTRAASCSTPVRSRDCSISVRGDDGTAVLGARDLRRSRARGRRAGAVRFTGWVDAYGTVFRGGLRLNAVTFESQVRFLGSQLEGPTGFARVGFGADATFRHCQFGGRAGLQSAVPGLDVVRAVPVRRARRLRADVRHRVLQWLDLRGRGVVLAHDVQRSARSSSAPSSRARRPSTKRPSAWVWTLAGRTSTPTRRSTAPSFARASTSNGRRLRPSRTSMRPISTSKISSSIAPCSRRTCPWPVRRRPCSPGARGFAAARACGSPAGRSSWTGPTSAASR